MKILSLFLFVAITSVQILAQHRVDRESWESSIESLKKESSVPLRIPAFFPYKPFFNAKQRKKRIFASTSGTENEYSLMLCFSTETCHSFYFYAEVTGEKISPQTEKLQSDQAVKLAKGIRGFYSKSSCGSSCAPESLQWDENGYRYTVSLEVNGKTKNIIDFANSAIDNNLTLTKQNVQGEVLNGKSFSFPERR